MQKRVPTLREPAESLIGLFKRFSCRDQAQDAHELRNSGPSSGPASETAQSAGSDESSASAHGAPSSGSSPASTPGYEPSGPTSPWGSDAETKAVPPARRTQGRRSSEPLPPG